MVKCCYKCGRSNKKDKDVTLFTIPTQSRGSKWQMEFIKRLGIEDFEDKEIHVCSQHFSPNDIEMKDYTLTLKENALPIEDDAELNEHVVVKPEIIYLKCDREDGEPWPDSASETSDTKDLVPLEPLVEYMPIYEENQELEEVQTEIKTEIIDGTDGVQDNNVEGTLEHNTEENVSQVISVVSSEGNSLEIEPMMPFFLTSSPVFTILNENNEVGETIILQIENSEEKRDTLPDPEQLYELQNFLCTSKGGGITSEYTCDICESSYGCLNCLKSHYETLHITNSITQYKCKYSNCVSKSLVCPVCDLMFPTRSEAMDHYITHSVACDVCGSGFDRQMHLTDHYKTVHCKGNYEIPYECEICKTAYQYPASLTKHYQTFHRMVLCYMCKLRFTSIRELQDHEKVHRQKLNVLPFACSKCDKAFPKISDIAVHIRQDHKKETVVECEHVVIKEPPESSVNSNDVQMPVKKKVKVKK